jgi:protein-tyrosine-phosphatase
VAGLLNRLRHVPDQLLHAARRRAAVAALAARQPPGYVLIICSGNLFRSPFAAAVLRRELERGPSATTPRVDSAGFTAQGRPSPPNAIGAAARRGIDLTEHRSQFVIADLARAADLIIVMEELQRRTVCERFGRAPRDVLLLGDLDPAAVTSRAIEDPVDQGPEVCDRAYARIERCVHELARAWSEGVAGVGAVAGRTGA